MRTNSRLIVKLRGHGLVAKIPAPAATESPATATAS
jgi:hypothetical protein